MKKMPSDFKSLFKVLNLGLSFFLELCLLATFGFVGYRLGRGSPTISYALAFFLPVIIATLWGLFLAPKALLPLARIFHVLAEIFLYGFACLLLAVYGKENAAILFAIAVTINVMFATIWRQ